MIEIIPNWHPIFVHFTVALLTTAVGFFLLARIVGNRPIRKQWLNVAHWNLWVGAGFALITSVAGFLAFNSVAHSTFLSHTAMETHRNWALATLAVLLVFTLMAWWNQHTKQAIQIPFLAVALLLLGLLFSTAWHGGELVYRYGIGVISSIPEESRENDRHTDTKGTGKHHHSSEVESVEIHKQADDKATPAKEHPTDGHSH